MIISPYGKKCTCGNHGCWELYAAEPVLFSNLREKLDYPNLTYHDIKQLIAENDALTYEEMEMFISFVSIGLNNLINLYHPETLVLNSEVLQLYPNAVEEIEKNLHSSVSVYQKIELSELGKYASVKGACALAIQNFFDVDEVIFRNDNP